MSRDEENLKVGKLIQQVESFFLVVIAILTVVGALKEMYLIGLKRDVGLQDLLLMFLYVEVLGMVAAYITSKQIPITLPIFIAITAIARVAILQKEQDPIAIIYESGAILMLAIAAAVVNFRPSIKPPAPRGSSPDDRAGGSGTMPPA
ncbi:phosphate-starvation-inducible E-like protein [Rhodomicrobium udaipurense JA643]|uniref:Protein PsiE n=1 Tax=Rhodomicrobium udaipurense TaxID=1202716 RepID=A0A8I1KK42_9HYPH|nr:phosphate-starvation-inducible PsiE family protein [Rhodomicrobium udaipurense]KAI94135.1 phosphate-starvation-inducible E-like protein [Rhodomicrobium udaipurense JA643]MBJ7543609.1 phosphate-starvation-inducible PsiE family protein [Rhodomicrobium udaipurense]